MLLNNGCVKLARWRVTSQMSITEAANFLGVKRTSYWQWESGRAVPRKLAHIAAVQSKCGIKPTDWLTFSEAKARGPYLARKWTVSENLCGDGYVDPDRANDRHDCANYETCLDRAVGPRCEHDPTHVCEAGCTRFRLAPRPEPRVWGDSSMAMFQRIGGQTVQVQARRRSA